MVRLDVTLNVPLKIAPPPDTRTRDTRTRDYIYTYRHYLCHFYVKQTGY